MKFLRHLYRDVPEIFWMLMGVLLIFAILAVGQIRISMASRDCLMQGFPDSRVTWGGFGSRYCVKRVDQTDVVVPLGD